MEDKYSKNLRILRKIFLIFFIVFLMIISFGLGLYFSGKNEVMKKLSESEAVYVGDLLGKYSKAADGKISQDVNFDLFWNAWDALHENYVDKEKLNEKEMFYGSIKGLVDSVGDPYTSFMDPQGAKEFSEDLAGTFEGIGAEIGIKNDILTIIAPLPDTPSAKAGLKPGDKIAAIDGEPTIGMSTIEAVQKIRGPKGTEVVLTIVRDGKSEPLEISVIRDEIFVKSVNTKYDEKNNIFIIEITNFNDDTQSLFNKAVKEAIQKNPKGIILDLRSNPGGYLDTAIEIASEWVDNGVVVVEKYKDDLKNEHLSRGRAQLKSFPTVVLINEGSASASEIVAGALQDHGLAKLVGMKTFGKGSVQSLINLDDGSFVKITVAKWLTPSGRSINDEGIKPDFEIDLTEEDYNADKDPQMGKAVELLKQ